jgi:hypothetical protein
MPWANHLRGSAPAFGGPRKENRNMEDWELMDRYTRKEAIEDGVLIDVTEAARQAGFKCPVALTCAVWCECVEAPAGVEGQDEAGRLWDVLHVLRVASTRGGGGAVVRFGLHVRNSNRPGVPPLVELKAVCGPDDDGGPCVTVMLPGED